MAADIYAAITGEPISDREKMSAVAERLRKQAMLGQIAQLAGDKVVAPLGANIAKSTEAQAENIGQRAEQARYRQYQEGASDRMDARELAEQKWREQDAADRLRFDYAKLASDSEDRRLMKALAAKDKADRDAEKAATAAEKDDEKAIALVAGRFQKDNMPGLLSAAEQINTRLKGYANKNIPSVGRLEGFKPAMLSGTESQILKADLAGFANQVLKMRSGAAVTDPELRRFLEEMATGGGIDEKTFRARWPQIMKVVQAEQDNILTALTPARREEYFKRMGGAPFVADDPFAQPKIVDLPPPPKK